MRKHHKPNNSEHMQQLYDEVGVDDEQLEAIEAIREIYNPELEELHEENVAQHEKKNELDPSSSDFVDKVVALFDTSIIAKRKALILKAEMKNKIANVLTEEQRDEIEELKEDFDENCHARRGHGRHRKRRGGGRC